MQQCSSQRRTPFLLWGLDFVLLPHFKKLECFRFNTTIKLKVLRSRCGSLSFVGMRKKCPSKESKYSSVLQFSDTVNFLDVPDNLAEDDDVEEGSLSLYDMVGML